MKVPAPQEPTQCWRDCMDEFTVIPALDLKGDAVVHAKSGNRADYRPIESPYGAADDPFAIARGLLTSYRLAVPLHRRSRRHRRRRQSFRAGPRAELRASRHRTVDRCRLLRCRRLRLLAAARGDAGDRQREPRRRRGLARDSCGVRRERRALARFRCRRPERSRRAVRRSLAVASTASSPWT